MAAGASTRAAGGPGTRPATRIRAALSRGLRNLGIDCGKCGLLVVDEDRPGAFGEFAAGVNVVIPETFTVTTAKGRHLYFRQPDGEPLGNGRGQLASRGIDIRGRGGFVVAPGSVHETGVLYTPVDPRAPVLPAPEWLAAALREAPRTPGPAAVPRCPGSVHGHLRGVLVVVLSAKPGERNTSLYWAACRAASPHLKDPRCSPALRAGQPTAPPPAADACPAGDLFSGQPPGGNWRQPGLVLSPSRTRWTAGQPTSAASWS